MKRSRNKYKPHQGEQEMARRLRTGNYLNWVNQSMKLEWFPTVGDEVIAAALRKVWSNLADRRGQFRVAKYVREKP